MKRKQSDTRHNPQNEKKEKVKTSGYVGDPRLTSRVRQYLEANRKRAVNVSTIAEDLQTKYGEYSRKKKDAFRKCVEKAYQAICKTTQDVSRNDEYSPAEMAHLRKRHKQGVSGGLASDDSSSDSESSESFSSENPDYVVYQETNTMNSFMTNLYKRDSKKSLRGSASADNSRHCSPLRTLSTPSSPRGKNTSEEIADCFIIDRTGDKKTPAKDKQQKSRTPKSCKAQNAIRKEVLSSEESAQTKPQEIDTGWVQTDKLTDISGKDSQVDKDAGKEVDGSRQRLQTEEEEVEGRAKSRGDKEKVVNKTEKPAKKKSKLKDKEEEAKKKGPVIQQSQVTFADIGGNDSTLRDVCKLLVHMKHPEVYQQLGVTPPRGFLLHGPPGCGKTLLANAIAGELELPFIKMAATEIVSGVSGESEEKVRDVFEKARASAPCIVFLDEIDAITQKRETASKDMERRIVSQLLTCMDDLNSSSGSHVLVIGATNRPDSLDPALRRAGRFDREISLGIPDENARERILHVLCRGLKLEVGFDFRQLAKDTPGFVGADLTSLAREAAITAVSRVFKELQTESVKQQTGATSTVMETSESVPVEEELHQSPGVTKGQNAETVMDCESGDVDKKCDNTETEPGDIKPIPNLREEGENAKREAANEVSLLNEVSGQQQEVSIKAQESQEEMGPLRTAPPAANLSSQEDGVTNQAAETGQTQSAETSEFQTVLSWLKDQPPLSREQLQNLWITRMDFEAALKVVQPSAKREGFATIPDVTWADIGALKDVREELQLAILAPVRHPEQFIALGLTNPPGILLAGPPGCGKTLLAKAVANESGINFISVKGPELLNMYVGESERAVRQVFQRARNSSPCVIFFDELDALCPRRSDAGEGGASVRVVNQLLTEMDGLEERKQVFIMAATNRPDIIDPAILRPGRLDKILYVGLPQSEERWDILKTITKNGSKPKLAEDVDLLAIASCEECQGYTGADLAAVVREASVAALKEFMMTSVTLVPGTSLQVNNQHFLTALQKVKPSVSEKDQIIYKNMREGIRR